MINGRITIAQAKKKVFLVIEHILVSKNVKALVLSAYEVENAPLSTWESTGFNAMRDSTDAPNRIAMKQYAGN
ncbi:hypothetical protein SOASR031_01230 [Leminorella grimontii]|nr:hypothetical protein SOASR031_01230 [Leminorella grimontii]